MAILALHWARWGVSSGRAARCPIQKMPDFAPLSGTAHHAAVMLRRGVRMAGWALPDDRSDAREGYVRA